jgi:hypothetical protein
MKKAQVVSELERSTLMEKVSWRQKSSALWLREGDKCTKFVCFFFCFVFCFLFFLFCFVLFCVLCFCFWFLFFFFFSHKMANSNRKKPVDSLLIDGTVSTNWGRSAGTLSSFIKSCIPSNLAGDLCWMAFTLILLVRLRLFGWREILRKESCWR